MKKSIRIAAAVLVIAVLASAGCSGGANVAKVNGVGIKTADFELLAAAAQKQDSTVASATAGSPELLKFQRLVLDSMVENELVRQAAKKEGATIGDKEVEAQLAQIKAGFPDEATFDSTLKASGMTLAQLQSSIKDQLLYQFLYDKVAPESAVTTADVQAYYDKNKTQFQSTAQSRLSHILISVPATATPAEAAAGKAKAEDVLKQLLAGGDFAALAKKYSGDTGSAVNGGDLGMSSTDSYVPEFKAAADKLKKGQMSGLVKTDYGYHIILKTDEQAAGQQKIEDVSETIKASLVQEKRNTVFQEYLASLKKAAKITIYDKKLKDVVATPAATTPAGQ
ncbi:MAG: peptidylprolyl isomerase [Actinomycetota bacterium]|nr:peptidylprolyl isomerase [Actinomycetota bacterium]MDP3630094.1 peptidylprolyl isomerase [Actinomycetota bacterium]